MATEKVWTWRKLLETVLRMLASIVLVFGIGGVVIAAGILGWDNSLTTMTVLTLFIAGLLVWAARSVAHSAKNSEQETAGHPD